MNPWLAFLLGGVLALGAVGLAFVIILERLKTDAEASRQATAGFFRALGIVGHFKSVLVVSGGEPFAVSFEDVARAIEKGDLLTLPTSSVHRSDRPPPLPGGLH